MKLTVMCPDCDGSDPVCFTCDGEGKIMIGYTVSKKYSDWPKWAAVAILFGVAAALWIVNLR